MIVNLTQEKWIYWRCISIIILFNIFYLINQVESSKYLIELTLQMHFEYYLSLGGWGDSDLWDLWGSFLKLFKK